jgi:hypothetical protein
MSFTPFLEKRGAVRRPMPIAARNASNAGNACQQIGASEPRASAKSVALFVAARRQRRRPNRQPHYKNLSATDAMSSFLTRASAPSPGCDRAFLGTGGQNHSNDMRAPRGLKTDCERELGRLFDRDVRCKGVFEEVPFAHKGFGEESNKKPHHWNSEEDAGVR